MFLGEDWGLEMLREGYLDKFVRLLVCEGNVRYRGWLG